MFFLQRFARLDLSFHSDFYSHIICLEKTSPIFPLKRDCSWHIYCVIAFFIAPTKILPIIDAFAYLVFCMCISFSRIEVLLQYPENVLAHSRCQITLCQDNTRIWGFFIFWIRILCEFSSSMKYIFLEWGLYFHTHLGIFWNIEILNFIAVILSIFCHHGFCSSGAINNPFL